MIKKITKFSFSAMILSVFIFLFTGCNQSVQNQTQQQEIPAKTKYESKTVTLTGKISGMPEQHMIDLQENYPFMDYFDTDKRQYVIYSKEKITCTGELTLKGKTIETEGTSKKPGSDEVYTEEQILVDSFDCGKDKETAADFILNEYPAKIIYTNDLSKAESMKTDCSTRGGVFNTCGSPCAPDAELCIQVCAYTCELSGVPEPLAPVTNINTDNWLSYTNQEAGFTIQYPSTLNKREGEGTLVTFSVWGPTQEPDTEFFDGISISFHKEPYEGTSSFEAFINSQVETEKQIAESVSEPLPIIIGGKSGFRVDIVSLGTYTNYYLPLDASYYLLISVIAPDPTEQGYAAIVNNLLESITFESAI